MISLGVSVNITDTDSALLLAKSVFKAISPLKSVNASMIMVSSFFETVQELFQ